MNIADAKQQIKDAVETYLTADEAGAFLIPNQAQRPMFLLGAPGIGKTAIVDQVASELGIGLVSYSMTHHTRQSALGLPVIVHRSFNGCEYDVSEYTMSEIIAAIYDYMEKTGHERGILFLDEINCVSETLYPSMLQFLQFKTFGRHAVPEGWIIVCAGNPPEYNKSVHDFDVVTLDRMRKLVIEPDLESWLAYAYEANVHPVITSYLEVKRDQFYLVESTPGNKSFVTARAWEDLSRTISLYEACGKSVSHTLIEQFLQNDQVASDFSQYYALFSKYRSDYQVPKILAGIPSVEIHERAARARFDERLALLGLIVDALNDQSADTLREQERIVAIRDALRHAKPEMLNGSTARESLSNMAQKLREEAQSLVDLGIATNADVLPTRLAANKIEGYATACEMDRVAVGNTAFDHVKHDYDEDVAHLHASVESCSIAFDNAFSFVEEVFGDGREMAVFVAELSGHRGTSCFISEFGSEAYFGHSEQARIPDNRKALINAIDELGIIGEPEESVSDELHCDFPDEQPFLLGGIMA